MNIKEFTRDQLILIAIVYVLLFLIYKMISKGRVVENMSRVMAAPKPNDDLNSYKNYSFWSDLFGVTNSLF